MSKSAEAQESHNALDNHEIKTLGAKMTKGTLGQRKTFWKFVGYKTHSITPRDLLLIIDIEGAAQGDVENLTSTKKAA